MQGGPRGDVARALRDHIAADGGAAKLASQAAPDAASLGALINTTILPRADARARARVRAMVAAVALALGHDITLHEWAAALRAAGAAGAGGGGEETRPRHVAARRAFDAQLGRIRVQIVLAPRVVEALQGGG